MRRRQESDVGRPRRESFVHQLELTHSLTALLEITTIYEKIKKGRDNEIHRLSKFGMPINPEHKLELDDEDETIPIVPSFPSNLSDLPLMAATTVRQNLAQTAPDSNSQGQVRYLDFNKYNGLKIRKYLYFSADTNMVQSDSLEDLAFDYKKLLRSKYYWLNITDPNETDLAMLFHSFNVHDFTISDIRETNTEEKIEFYQHYTFMSTRLLRVFKIGKENEDSSSGSGSGSTAKNYHDHDPTKCCTDQKHNTDKKPPVDMDFNILLFKNFVITMHDKKWDSINDILGFVNLICAETVLSPDWVLYSIFIELAQDAQYLLSGIEPKLNELRVRSTNNTTEMSRVLHRNYEMEFQLYSIQRFVKPKVNILRTLKLKCGKRFGRILLKLLNELRDDFVEMNHDLKNLNYILERSQDTFLALVNVEKSREANEMSLIMKRISQIALVFLPIQAISGFFGMNVLVPWQNDMYRDTMYFWILVGMSFAIGVAMYLSRSLILFQSNSELTCCCWNRNRNKKSGQGQAEDDNTIRRDNALGTPRTTSPSWKYYEKNKYERIP